MTRSHRVACLPPLRSSPRWRVVALAVGGVPGDRRQGSRGDLRRGADRRGAVHVPLGQRGQPDDGRPVRGRRRRRNGGSADASSSPRPATSCARGDGASLRAPRPSRSAPRPARRASRARETASSRSQCRIRRSAVRSADRGRPGGRLGVRGRHPQRPGAEVHARSGAFVGAVRRARAAATASSSLPAGRGGRSGLGRRVRRRHRQQPGPALRLRRGLPVADRHAWGRVGRRGLPRARRASRSTRRAALRPRQRQRPRAALHRRRRLRPGVRRGRCTAARPISTVDPANDHVYIAATNADFTVQGILEFDADGVGVDVHAANSGTHGVRAGIAVRSSTGRIYVSSRQPDGAC